MGAGEVQDVVYPLNCALLYSSWRGTGTLHALSRRTHDPPLLLMIAGALGGRLYVDRLTWTLNGCCRCREVLPYSFRRGFRIKFAWRITLSSTKLALFCLWSSQ